jgi:hypothetical protein
LLVPSRVIGLGFGAVRRWTSTVTRGILTVALTCD